MSTSWISLSILAVVVMVTVPTGCLDNGLARTPPMGWMSWQRYRCNTDCVNYPDDCISDSLVRRQADAMVKYGFKDAGYNYLALDDCWMDKKRDSHGNLQADTSRFKDGIKPLADYVHSKGLKLGLLMSIGNSTCAHYPGSYGHLEQDAKTLAGWGVDMVKVGACNVSDKEYYNTAFPELGYYFNQTGRKVLYSCQWPLYVSEVDWTVVDLHCNTYRTYAGNEDSWKDLEEKLKHWGDVGKMFLNWSMPGSWNDADQMVVGDYGLSVNQQRLQMALWSIMSSPLFISADLANMEQDSKEILQNKRAIAINQDYNGAVGYRIILQGELHIWQKPISPPGSFALALMYTNSAGGPTKVSVKLSDMGMTTAAAYMFTDVFTGKEMGVYKPWYTLDCEVNNTGALLIEAKVYNTTANAIFSQGLPLSGPLVKFNVVN